MRDFLAAGGTGVAEMTRAGLPVPPGLHHHDRGRSNEFLPPRRRFTDRGAEHGRWPRLNQVEKKTGSD